MKARPILFSAPMVRALREGRKTQTRRIVKAKHLPFVEHLLGGFLDGKWNQRPLPYGKPGDLLYVRETWAPAADNWGAFSAWNSGDKKGPRPDIFFAADGVDPFIEKWRPSIHMPRWASRLTLRIKAVRVQRLQEISEADAMAEGIERVGGAASCSPWRNYRIGEAGEMSMHCSAPERSYMTLWEWINGPESWAANPWVWVVEFEVIQANVNQVLREAA